MPRHRRLLVAMGWIACGLMNRPSQADVRVPRLFTDSMVLQQAVPIPVWGTADEGEAIQVRLGEQAASTTARDGRWMVKLPPMKAGGPHTLTIAGTNTIRLTDVMIGEVWVCSGQSNMAWPVSMSAGAEEVLSGPMNRDLRLFTVPRRWAPTPETDLPEGQWVPCAPAEVAKFSAVGYFFGMKLQQDLGVPVGLINSSVGGTPAEAWTPREALEAEPDLRGLLAATASAPAARPRRRAGGVGSWPSSAPAVDMKRPTGLYNAMIRPLQPFAIRGVIWYQGEGNAPRAYQYRTLFPTMIASWRRDWGQGAFPFLFVQLAPYMKKADRPTESAWAELREAQLLTMRTTPNTAMAVITDAGDENDIHPKAKRVVGERLALAAEAIAYGQKVEYLGPLYERLEIRGSEAVLHFSHTTGGLVARGGSLRGFTIAGEDRVFVNAEARIEADTVVVWSPQVSRPVAVRYGWADYPLGNLWNGAGLPASPFRTDDFPGKTAPPGLRPR